MGGDVREVVGGHLCAVELDPVRLLHEAVAVGLSESLASKRSRAIRRAGREQAGGDAVRSGLDHVVEEPRGEEV